MGNRLGSKEVSLKRQIGSCLFREASTKTEVGPSSVSRTSVANRCTVERVEAYDTRRVNPKSFRRLNGGKANMGVSFYSRGPISFQGGGDSPAQETRSVRARCQPGPRPRIGRSQKREERHRPDTPRRKITVPFYTFIRNELLQRPTFPRCSGLTVSFDSVPENSNAGR